MSDVSDHFAQVCVLSSPKNCTPDTKTPRRDFSYFNPDQINHELKHLNWSMISDPDCCFSTFYNKLNLHQHEKIVNSELLQVSNWLQANKLTLNFKKSNYMIFRPYHAQASFIFSYYQSIRQYP